MAQPTQSQVHVNRPLTNISVAFLQKSGYVAGQVFPFVPSDKASNQYWTFDRTFFLRREAEQRAAGTVARRKGMGVSTATFTTVRDAIAYDLPDPVRANADEGLNLERAAVELVTQDMLIAQEVRWVTAFFGTSIWNADTTPGTLWDNVASTPIEDIEARRIVMEENTGGYSPNTFVMGAQAWSETKNHPDLIDRIKYTQRGVMSVELFAQLIEVPKVLVARASRNTAAEGVAGSYDYIAGQTNALLTYSAPTPGAFTPSAGYTFTWSGAPDGAGNSYGLAIKKYRRPEEYETDSIEINSWYVHSVVSSVLGEFFSAVVT